MDRVKWEVMGAETVAVVLATMPAAGLPCAQRSVLGRLTDQLVALPVRELHIVVRADDALFDTMPGLSDGMMPGVGTSPGVPDRTMPGMSARIWSGTTGMAPDAADDTIPGTMPGIAGGAMPGTSGGTMSGTAGGAADGRAQVRRRRGVSVSGGLADDLRRVAKIAKASTCPVVVLPGDVVAHTEALARLIEDPSRSTAALVGGGEPGPLRPPVRTERGRIVAAGNAFHQVESANATFGGVLRVAEAHLAGLADVAEELADLAQSRRLGSAGDNEVSALLLAGLVRAGVPVRAAGLGGLRCQRVGGQLAADMAMRGLSEVDEQRATLEAAVKKNDGFFTTYCVSSWSLHVVRLAARLRLTPNAITGMSVGLAVIAAIWFSAGDRTAQVVGAVALYLSFVLDCVDGQLARYTRRFSPLGAWLDGISDRVKEYVVYVGLAVGYAAGARGGPTGPHGIWALAVGAMILQSIRHMVDFSYSGAVADAEGDGAAATCRHSPLSVSADPARTDSGCVDSVRTDSVRPDSGRTDSGCPDSGCPDSGCPDSGCPDSGCPDSGRPDSGRVDSDRGDSVHADRMGQVDSVRTGNVVVEMSRRLNRGTATRWLKKVIVLPIGERMALIAITAALFNARVTFLALLVWGGIALAYTVTGRIARSLT